MAASDQIVEVVNSRIDKAIRDNAGSERLISVVLITLFVAGIVLILWGAYHEQWTFLVPGGMAEMALVFPVRQLVKMRADNMSLQVIPPMLRLAGTDDAKTLAMELIQRLIRQL